MMEDVQEKKDNKIIYIIIVVLLIIGAFAGGYFLNGSLNSSKCNEEQENTNKDKQDKTNTDVTPIEKTETKPSSKPMDNIVVNLYGGGYVYYIYNNDAYYLKADLLDDSRWFLLTYSPCLREDKGDNAAYCEGNPVYNREAVKVEGITDVVKLRLLHRPGATDESFETFAVDKTGNAYIIRDGVATKYYGNNDVEDILSDMQVLLKDGTTKTIE